VGGVLELPPPPSTWLASGTRSLLRLWSGSALHDTLTRFSGCRSCIQPQSSYSYFRRSRRWHNRASFSRFSFFLELGDSSFSYISLYSELLRLLRKFLLVQFVPPRKDQLPQVVCQLPISLHLVLSDPANAGYTRAQSFLCIPSLGVRTSNSTLCHLYSFSTVNSPICSLNMSSASIRRRLTVSSCSDWIALTHTFRNFSAMTCTVRSSPFNRA